MADRFMATVCRHVTDLLRAECTPPTYSYLPDDVAHLPVLVVGRPTMTESGTPAVMTVTLDVVLLGRRISDDDSQMELLVLADELFDALGGTRGVKVEDQPFRCTAHTAGTVTVAGLEYPAYVATVNTEVLSC